jgi:hypothetical protein
MNAVWYSKLGVGNSGFGYAKHINRERPAQKDATATGEIVRILFNFQCHILCDTKIGRMKAPGV